MTTSSRSEDLLPSPVANVGRLCLIAAATFILAAGSLLLIDMANHVSPLWPANAVGVAVLFRTPSRRWLGSLVAALTGIVAAFLVLGANGWLASILTLANGLDIALCAMGVRVVVGRDLDLTRGKDLAAFAVSVGVVAPLASGLLAAWVRASQGGGPFLTILTAWWAAKALGVLVLTPALVTITTKDVTRLIAPERWPRTAALTVALALCLAGVFLQARYPMLFMVMPVLMLVTFYLGLAGGALAVVLTAAAAVPLTLNGLGPISLVHGDLNAQMTFLQVFLLAATLTVLGVAALIGREQRLQLEQTRLLDRLAESELRFRSWADNASDVVMLCGTDGLFSYLSPSVERVTGYSVEELIGRRFSDIVHPDDAERAEREIEARVRAPRDQVRPPITYRVICKDGSVITAEARPELWRDPATGQLAGVSDIVHDVTARRRMEEGLTAARDAAQAAAQVKTDFLANMSHEIRTPLTAILGFSSMLEGVETLPTEARLYVRRIVAGGRALLSVVNDILDFSKLEAGHVQLEAHPFDPAECLDSAFALITAQAAEKGLDLDLRLEKTLPAFIVGDSARLRQILLNLLNNAVKFTSKGGITLTGGYDSTTGQLIIAVADTGTGIPTDKRDKLFQRFSQVDSSINRHYGGTGLGLAICRSLIDLMGGDISVVSASGEGSTFTLSIPAAVSDGLAAVDPDAARGQMPPQEIPAHILVVDDLADNRELVRLLLEFMGHRIDEATSGVEAVAMAGAQKFDLILMDMQMPDVDGLVATGLIRQSQGPNAPTPILAFTANVLGDQVAQCLAAGMNDHISKPILADELMAKVSRWAKPGASSDMDISPRTGAS